MTSWTTATTVGIAWFIAGAVSAAESVPVKLMASLNRLAPEISEQDVRQSPLPGIYEVSTGGQVLYVSSDGRYLLRGDLIDVVDRKNLSEGRRKTARLVELSKLKETNMIVFNSPKATHRVTVFTDVDCGYCAKLHQQMAQYNELGIDIRYLAFPRAGLESRSYEVTVSVWCSDDPQEAIGEAKARRPVEPRTCENPVRSHYMTGRRLGVSGTPTMITDDGTVIPGYLPPEQLLAQLNAHR